MSFICSSFLYFFVYYFLFFFWSSILSKKNFLLPYVCTSMHFTCLSATFSLSAPLFNWIFRIFIFYFSIDKYKHCISFCLGLYHFCRMHTVVLLCNCFVVAFFPFIDLIHSCIVLSLYCFHYRNCLYKYFSFFATKSRKTKRRSIHSFV